MSLKKALAVQGFEGGSRGVTELNQWRNSEKEALAEIMRQHGIEWEQLGTQNEHLTVKDSSNAIFEGARDIVLPTPKQR